jgi:hypothetical protein
MSLQARQRSAGDVGAVSEQTMYRSLLRRVGAETTPGAARRPTYARPMKVLEA